MLALKLETCPETFVVGIDYLFVSICYLDYRRQILSTRDVPLPNRIATCRPPAYCDLIGLPTVNRTWVPVHADAPASSVMVATALATIQ